MNDTEELKQYGVAHARAQRISLSQYQEVCARIHTDDHDAPGSWVGEWAKAADSFERRGNHLRACSYYNLARFPYVDGPARDSALHMCVDACTRWASAQGGVERLELDLDGGRVVCWTSGLSKNDRKPLLLVTGGIISIKEQWVTLLPQVERLGLSCIITEMPGVGENDTQYTRDSWNLLSELLDKVADRAHVEETYAMALSFSGHMALRCAARDRRIKGIMTVAAPVSEFFTNQENLRRLPRVTVNTLAHLMDCGPTDVAAQIKEWSLGKDELRALEIPVYYVGSRKDEIIPTGDLHDLRHFVRGLHTLVYDEEHAAPRYATETRIWIMLSLVTMRQGLPLQRIALSSAWHVLRSRRWFVEKLT